MGAGQRCREEPERSQGPRTGRWPEFASENWKGHTAERELITCRSFLGFSAEYWSLPVFEETTWPGKEPDGEIQGSVSHGLTRSGMKPVPPSECITNVGVKRSDHPCLNVAARPPGSREFTA